jgi:hypothetical protein
MPVELILQVFLTPRILDATNAEEMTNVIVKLKDAASFRNILRDAGNHGISKDNQTLWRYLDPKLCPYT